MTSARLLIVNADDFGLHPIVNRGVVAGHERGIITSASLMVRQPAAEAAAGAARQRPGLGVGLHVDLEEHEYRDGEWRPTYRVVATDDAGAIAEEVARQVEAFRRLMGRDPTHLDSHQHVHRDAPVREVLTELARGLGVPLRHFDARVKYCGFFYGQSATGSPCHEYISTESLIRVIEGLPDGVTELACHPADFEGEDAGEFRATYGAERGIELRALCDPWVARAVRAAGITLGTFADVGK
jgi:predicted glycoside hydrolase/deacetylase ChbG (UPF0249 family)